MAAVLFAPSAPLAAAELNTSIEVAEMTMVERRRISRTHFDYYFEVRFVNNGEPAVAAEAFIRSHSNAISVETGRIRIGDMPDATPVAGDRRLLLTIDRRTPFDPEQLEWQFFVAGEPEVVVTPEAFDFRGTLATCEAEVPVRIENVGTERLDLDNLFVTPSDVRSTLRLELSLGLRPWQLRPGEFREGRLRYLPTELGEHVGALRVESNDPDKPVLEIPIEASSTASAFGNESFVQAADTNPKVDVLMAIDKSSSMGEELAAVSANAKAFAADLQTYGADFRFAIAVEDNGCINGEPRWIDAGTDPDNIDSIVETMLGTRFDQPDTERLYTIASRTLSPANLAPGGCNEGFVRADARLDVVFVSDEPEQSINSWSVYVLQFEAIKPTPGDVTLHAIAGDYPSGCATASAGTGYFEGVSQTGGQFLSICTDDWAGTLATLADAAAGNRNTSFRLAVNAVPNSVRVWVDGVAQESGWRHVANYRTSRFFGTPVADAIHFDTDHVPAEGESVVVDYAIVPQCPN
ncbi:MAG: hypothetical protein RLW62_02475 [Gammaproteobacteria bacterium]